MRDPNAGLGAMLARSARRRCPRCGTPGAFESWSTLREWCPACGFAFERESGYWVGAMIINTTVTFGLFIVVMVGWAVATWPDVPWTALLVTGLALMLVVPIAFYPWSKSFWMAIELSYHQLEPEEREAAARRAAG